MCWLLLVALLLFLGLRQRFVALGQTGGLKQTFLGKQTYTQHHTTLSWRFPNWLPEEVCSWVGNLPTGQKSSFWKENIQLKCAQEALVSLSQTNLFARFRTFVFCRKTPPTKTRKQLNKLITSSPLARSHNFPDLVICAYQLAFRWFPLGIFQQQFWRNRGQHKAIITVRGQMEHGKETTWRMKKP